MSIPTAMPACLYIVATPIGNLTDMTPHAVDTLKQVAIIACEDTRTSGKLLSHFGIDTKDTKGSKAGDEKDSEALNTKNNTDNNVTEADTATKQKGHNKLWAYHEHNSAIQTPKIIEMIEQGHSVALISDAGTPLISDPVINWYRLPTLQALESRLSLELLPLLLHCL